MPRTDTRKRDRAAYFRDYRAKKAAERPKLEAQIEALTARLVALEEDVRRLSRAIPDPIMAATRPFGGPRPAPKRAGKG